jgi:hypothetical protein
MQGAKCQSLRLPMIYNHVCYLPFVSPCLFFYSPGPKVRVCVFEVALAGMLFVKLLRPFVQILIEQVVVQWLVHDARREQKASARLRGRATGEVTGEAENAKEAEK